MDSSIRTSTFSTEPYSAKSTIETIVERWLPIWVSRYDVCRIGQPILAVIPKGLLQPCASPKDGDATTSNEN